LSRRNLLTRSLAVAALCPVRTFAQHEKSVFMVLWRGETEVEAGFRAHFEERGLPVNITVRSLDRDIGRLPSIIAEISEVDPDIVYSWGTSVTLGLAGRDPDLMEGPDDFPPQILDRPIVFTMVSQPIKSRIIKRFGPTGRNVTGVSHLVPLEAQLEAMRAYMPVDRIAVIFTPSELNSVLAVEKLTEAGQHLNIRIDQYPVPLDTAGQPDPASLPILVASVAASGPQFLYLGPDSFLGQYAQEITDIANSYRLPSFASVEHMLSASDALYGLVAPYQKVGRFTATKAERILFDDADPSEVPVELLPEFSYRIRSDVARELGIFPRLALLDYAVIVEP